MKLEEASYAGHFGRSRFKLRLNLLRLTLAATLVLHALGLYALLLPVYEDGLLFTSRRWMLITALGMAVLIIELALLGATLFAKRLTLRKIGHCLIQSLSHLKTLNLVFYLLLFALCSVLIFAPIYGLYVPGFITILSAYWFTALAGSLFLKSWGAGLAPTHDFNRSWPAYLGFSLLLTTFGFRIVQALQDISIYPFTLGWSETSRYYYASLFFAEKLYSLDIPPTVLHPSRYLMQAVPFLLPDSPLWLHRAWQVFLWIGTTLLTSWMLLRRLAIASQWNRALLFITSFLFLLIGPVYYHLQVPVILILWGFRNSPAERPWLRFFRSLIVVVTASAWAGISRVNWYPLPGLLAACIYLIEKPVIAADAPEGRTTLRSMIHYLVEPAAWTILGMAVAFSANTLYIHWSGNPVEQFTTSFSSALLWYRLLPSSTYLPGILPGALITSLPFLYLICNRLNLLTSWRQFHPLRLSGLIAVLLVFFTGGLVVSVKIGGGSNLHNMDAYMALLWVIASMIFFDKLALEKAPTASPTMPLTPSMQFSWPQFWAALSIVIILFFSFLDNAVRPPLPGQTTTDRGLAIIAQRAAEAHQQGGEILFISNRHLLTFGYISGVPLFPDYERVFLMEMAMANDAAYLDRLRQDLENNRFSLIISEPLYVRIKDETAEFGEENNIWIKQVVRLIRCYYNEDANDDDEKFMMRELQIQFFVPDPKPNPARCPKE